MQGYQDLNLDHKFWRFGCYHYTIPLGRTSFGLRINRYQKYPNRNDGREPIILVPINEHRAPGGNRTHDTVINGGAQECCPPVKSNKPQVTCSTN